MTYNQQNGPFCLPTKSANKNVSRVMQKLALFYWLTLL